MTRSKHREHFQLRNRDTSDRWRDRDIAQDYRNAARARSWALRMKLEGRTLLMNRWPTFLAPYYKGD
jgi:hypothetical protein